MSRNMSLLIFFILRKYYQCNMQFTSYGFTTYKENTFKNISPESDLTHGFSLAGNSSNIELENLVSIQQTDQIYNQHRYSENRSTISTDIPQVDLQSAQTFFIQICNQHIYSATRSAISTDIPHLDLQSAQIFRKQICNQRRYSANRSMI